MGNSLRVAGAAVVAAVAIVAAGCGSNGSPSASSGTTTTTTAPGGGASTAARQAFEQCMAQHGVTITGRPPGGGNGQPPAGGPGGGGGGGLANMTAAQRQAFTACRSKLPAGGRSGGAPGANRSNPAFAKYTACLKQHGVTFGASNNQKAFATASAACAKYRPAAGAGGGTSLQ
jgi:hypothetical protein